MRNAEETTPPPPIPTPLNPNYIPLDNAYTPPPLPSFHPTEHAALHQTTASIPLPHAPPPLQVIIDKNNDIDTIMWWDRLQWYMARGHVWYERQSHDTQLMLKAGLVLLLLYVTI